jgi:hypothetical protein
VIAAAYRAAEHAFAAQLTPFKHPNGLILLAAGDFVAAT